MTRFDRRSFLSLTSGSLVTLAAVPLTPLRRLLPGVLGSFHNHSDQQNPGSCWLDVCAPFVVEDAELGIHSEIVLTSDTFVGRRGYEDDAELTEYEIYLYDAEGKAFGADGIAKRLAVPAMQTTVIPARELIGTSKSFWGGMKIRLRPRGRLPMHASDLFSSAFLRWKTASSFDNVHANPDPLEWQRPDSFFYSMPFPPLAEYESIFSLFNPYEQRSVGVIALYDQLGLTLKEIPYELKPHASLLFDLRKGDLVIDVKDTFGVATQKKGSDKTRKSLKSEGGTIVVTNQQGSVKNFGYLLIKSSERQRFSVEHPIHQPPYNPIAATTPFDAEGRFKARNVLYTPLLFRSKKIGGITLESRFHLSSGAPMEEFLWLRPFITDAEGNVPWQLTTETKLPAAISSRQIERGVIKLGARQSCVLDCSEIAIPQNFSGGLSLAVAPNTNHTLMKIEVSVPEWRAHAFTHLRPGLRSARGYQKPKSRGGLATDYIASGACFEKMANKVLRDEIIGVMNIDDTGIGGEPSLEIFSQNGLLTRVSLGHVPGFGCRYYLLSDLLSGNTRDLSLRLVDEQATLLMSVIHLDYVRSDIALDHGSDRFSTFNDFDCDAVTRT